MGASYFTWAADGTILFWNVDGTFKDSLHVALEQIEGLDALPNELRTVHASADASFLVTGDKYGVLRIIDSLTKTSIYDFKAHAGEITSISVHEEAETEPYRSSRGQATHGIFYKHLTSMSER
jgi:WD40 repeat protein